MCLLINPSKITNGYNSENKRVLVAKWVAEAWEIKTKKEMVIRAFKKCDTTNEEGGSKNHLVNFEEINYLMPQAEEECHLESSNDENTDNSYSANDAKSSPDSDENNEPTPENNYVVAYNLYFTKTFCY